MHRISEAAGNVMKTIREMESLFSAISGNVTLMNRYKFKWMRSDGGYKYIGGPFKNRLTKR